MCPQTIFTLPSSQTPNMNVPPAHAGRNLSFIEALHVHKCSKYTPIYANDIDPPLNFSNETDRKPPEAKSALPHLPTNSAAKISPDSTTISVSQSHDLQNDTHHRINPLRHHIVSIRQSTAAKIQNTTDDRMRKPPYSAIPTESRE
ncbi:hypothetical protein P154DRAFT_535220 [Amniculicola lignicola CBS 123094]|uniref:Uncharacterized protein n=1 Tax=Amniculicola lignicola CBS 123094 TaxID=1392246 RepID=A0A6A5WDH0_9PLEO|nr:hypothetical protein P154DRAFT_535220 [Amniculicola lignicola CBS 123094]